MNNELVADQTTASSRPQGRMLIIAILLYLGMVNVLLSRTFELISYQTILAGAAAGLLAGFFVGQLNLISVWAAANTSRAAVVRIPWCLLLLVLMWSLVMLGELLPRSPEYPTRYYNSPTASTLLTSLIIGCFVTQVPVWLFTRITGWRFVRPQEFKTNRKFGVQDLLIGTLLVAAAFALFRTTVFLRGFQDIDPFGTTILTATIRINPMFVILAALAVVNVVLVAPCIWFSQRWRFTAPTIFMLTLATVMVTIVEILTITGIVGPPGGQREASIYAGFLFINLGQVCCVIVVLRSLRDIAGFRLIKLQDLTNDESVPESELDSANESATEPHAPDDDFFE